MINKYDELLKTANWLEETDLPVAIVLRDYFSADVCKKH